MKDISFNLATKIESRLYAEMNDEINKEYGKKFRDLLTGLKNDENIQLRTGLLSGNTKPEDFVSFDRVQLLPKSLIEMREKS